MVVNAIVGYSMCVVQYPQSWLSNVQRSIIAALKQSMRIPANMDDKPFLMPPSEGGRGLVSLKDLQSAVLCVRTAQELTSQALSSHTINATWHHAFVFNDSHIGRWTAAIREMGWQAWPRTSDLDWVGHFVADPALAHTLVSKGIFRWLHMTDSNRLKPANSIVGTMGIGVTDQEYQKIRAIINQSTSLPTTPLALARRSLRELNRFSALPEELHDLHYNHSTNTLTMFTDGSCANGHSARAVYFAPRSRRNWAFAVAAAPISMVAELHAIEEALLCTPAGVNICVATDSKASIEAITNWHTWKPGRRSKQEGRGVIERITALVEQLRNRGRVVKLQHIYSHISHKLSAATALGEADKFQAKLQLLKDELWGPFRPWMEGNEGADQLASLGHSKPHVLEPWTVPALAEAVTIFDSNGHVVEGNVRRKALSLKSKNWTLAMRRKPVRGAVLRDEHTDRTATHSALDNSRDPATRRMGNFLHKARYGALPLKHTRHRLYWGKAEDGSSVARSPPANARSDRKRLTKWVARQIQFDDQTCHLCAAGAKETTAHVLGGECSLHVPSDLATGRAVRDLIRAKASSHSAYVDHVPLWFPHGNEPDSPVLLAMATFSSLASYNKLMGGLGYVPSGLHQALGYFGIANRNALIRDIATCIAKAAHDKWRHRCSALVESDPWKAANEQAESLVSAGIG